MMDEFKPSRKLFSSYYIAIIISFFVFQLFGDQWATFSSNYIVDLFSTVFNSDFRANGRLWFIFFFSMLVITLLIRRFIVEPLGLYTNNTDPEPWWESLVMFILIFGFYIFLLNITFRYAMPIRYFSEEVITFLGGYRNTFLPNDPNPLAGTPTFVTWFWYLAPITFMYMKAKVAIKPAA